MLWRYRGSVQTITADNGLEFYEHEKAAIKLRTNIHFANPYPFWERGLNENFNEILRQYIKKGTFLVLHNCLFCDIVPRDQVKC